MVAGEILELACLAGIEPKEVGRHFVIGASSGTAAVVIQPSPNQCAVVTSIEVKNADASLTQTLSVKSATAQVDGVNNQIPVMAGDVLMVFGAGKSTLNFTFTPSGGFTPVVKISGYFLPLQCLPTLSRHKTLFTKQ